MHTALVVIAAIGIVGYVIGRQLLGEPLRAKRVVLLPLVLTVIGAVDLGKESHHPQAIDVVLIVLSALIAAGIGLRQGAMVRLESRDGGLWGQLPVKGLWLWGALVLSRVIIDVVASACGAHVAASTSSILLVLGINRLAQAAWIATRAFTMGIPFAPETAGRGLAPVRSGNDMINPRTAGVRTDRISENRMSAVSAVGTALQERRSSRHVGRERRRGADGRRVR